MKSTKSLIVRIVLFASAMLALLVGVFQTIGRPVAGGTDTFTAEFTDANGLKSGDDVRMYGVRVGQVIALTLDGTRARVRFTVERGHPVYDNSRPAVRYQNLNGQRYLEVQQPDSPGMRHDPHQIIGPDTTIPAFDITTLFNGLQPVLAELTPADLNTFATSLLAVVQGNGSGIGPALDSIEKLSQYTTDRQQVIATLVGNLREVSDHLGGKSGNTVQLIAQVTQIFETATQRVRGLIDFSVSIPPVLTPVHRLLTTMGLHGDPNPALDQTIRTAFPDPQQAVDVLNRTPGMIQALSATLPSTGPDVDRFCAHGIAPTPPALRVFIGGQEVTLCNR